MWLGGHNLSGVYGFMMWAAWIRARLLYRWSAVLLKSMHLPHQGVPSPWWMRGHGEKTCGTTRGWPLISKHWLLSSP